LSAPLDRLAEAYGLLPSFISEAGDTVIVTDEAKRGALAAMGVAVDDEAAMARSLAAAPPPRDDSLAAHAALPCFVPDWLRQGRVWGVTCQLYALQSARNWGIGDFSDLARLAEIVAGEGGDFVGVNPLHALFLAEPERCGPFAPSNRRFLNPLYIAVDEVAGFEPEDLEAVGHLVAEARASEHVSYRAVAAAKLAALAAIFARGKRGPVEGEEKQAFAAFWEHGGEDLYHHAVFEALSEAMVARGAYSGWHSWPQEYRDHRSDTVRRFAEEKKERVAFHCWLQWLADPQLRAAQARARAAGMGIGLYVDLAVGVAPDGSTTWSDPKLVVTGARIGAPPGVFNEAGQDWGLAPYAPAELETRGFAPLSQMLADVMRHAGAVRIDHAMGLTRLYWIPDGLDARNGAYVSYPTGAMMGCVAEASQACRTLVIGEDLGTVPPGFRELMHEADMHGYRVLYFERREDHGFLPPHAYPREALACISTHDLAPLRGWWRGHDIDLRERAGLPGGEDSDARRPERARDRRLACLALAEEGLLPHEFDQAMRGERDLPQDLPESLLVALHRYLARAPSRLLGVQLDDLTGAVEQVNVPGTVDDQPNWRRRVPVALEQLPEAPSFRAVCQAVREERPRGR
jgi:4-alpha-glucanotransferase